MSQFLIINFILLWIVVLFNLLLTVALIRRWKVGFGFSMMDIPKLKKGQLAPEFSAETLNGKAVTLASYVGQAVVFLFISPDCAPCRELIPKLNMLQPKAEKSGVELILVSQADAEKTQTFIAEQKATLPVLVAPKESNSFMDSYKVSGTPFYCFIDSMGKIEATGFLGPEWEELISQW